MQKALAKPGKNLAYWLAKLNTFAASPLARRLVFGVFIIQAVVLAFVMHIYTPPDEKNHTLFIDYYAHHSLSPNLHDQTPTYYLGDKTREPDFMYHYLMSLVYRITPLSVHYKFVVIRLLTAAIALASFYLLTKIFKRLGFSETITTVSLLVLTNLAMVLMVSTAVNNDVTVWFGISLGVLLLLRLKERAYLPDMLGLALVIIWGGLFKRDLLPMSLLFGIVALIFVVKSWKKYLAGFRQLNKLSYLLIALLVVGSALFIERIGGNIVHYGTVTPTCEQVQSKQACSVFWINFRANLLESVPKQQVSPPKFFAKWVGESTYNIVNVQTQFWRRDVKPLRLLTPLLTLLLLAGVIYGAFYEFRQRKKADKFAAARRYVLFIALFYATVQLAVNYATFLHNRIFGLALNGRYVLPSIMLLTGLSCFYLSKLLVKRNLATALALVVIVLIIMNSGLQLLLRNPQLYKGY